MDGSVPVTDNSGSLTVDAPVGTPMFVRLSDGTAAIATLPVSLAALPATVADGGALPSVVAVIGGYDGANAQVLKTDATGVLQVDVEAALPAGTNNIGDVDVASMPALPTGTNSVGDVGVVPRTSGGLSIATDIDLDETELEVKSSAGQLFGWYVYNDAAAEVYVKLYNDTAANVVVGTTAPVMTFGVPAGSAANAFNPHGIVFSAGICAAATTVVTTADTTAPALNQVVANFLFK